MTTWEDANARMVRHLAAITQQEPDGARVTVNMAPKSQDRLSVAPPGGALPGLPAGLSQRPMRGLGDLNSGSMPMPERRGAGPDDSGYDIERAWQRETNMLPDRAGDALEGGYRNTVDRAGLGAYQNARPNPLDDLGGMPRTKFRD